MIGRSWNSSSVSVADSRNSVLLPGVQPKLHANDMKENDVNEKGGENEEKNVIFIIIFQCMKHKEWHNCITCSWNCNDAMTLFIDVCKYYEVMAHSGHSIKFEKCHSLFPAIARGMCDQPQ